MTAPRRSGGAVGHAWRVLVGRPLRSSEVSKERITPVEGLSALSLDALTSVAYGPEAIIVVVAVAGSGALHLVLPITGVIVALLAILVFSYRQVIDAYPGGGGAYAVSRANLGARVSLVAGASLVVDYTLTVAVSIAAGVGALTSAFPSLTSATVPICLGILAVVTVLNLRGLGETARAFLLPTMVFIVGLLAIIAVGFIHPLGTARPAAWPLSRAAARTPDRGHPARAESVLGRLQRTDRSRGDRERRAAVQGASARPRKADRDAPRPHPRRDAPGPRRVARRWHVAHGRNRPSWPDHGHGRRPHWAYYIVSLTVTLVLALREHVVRGVPVLASLLARDNYLPHLFALRGDRRVFANGIWALAVFRRRPASWPPAADTNSLIPFVRHRRVHRIHPGPERPRRALVAEDESAGWRRRASVDGLGAMGISHRDGRLPLHEVHGRCLGGRHRGPGLRAPLPACPCLLLADRPESSGFGQRAAACRKPSRRSWSSRWSAISRGYRARVVRSLVARPGGARRHGRPEGGRWQWKDQSTALAEALGGLGIQVYRCACSRRSRVRGGTARRVHRRVALDDDEQIVVLIPVTIPVRARYQSLHNQIDLVLSSALRRARRRRRRPSRSVGGGRRRRTGGATPPDGSPTSVGAPPAAPSEGEAAGPARAVSSPQAPGPAPGQG